jgi:hypothetical protein
MSATLETGLIDSHTSCVVMTMTRDKEKDVALVD